MGILDSQQKVIYNSETSEVVIRKKRGNQLRTPFAAIGPLTNVKFRKIMKPDVFDLLDKVSKGAFSVFNNLKYNRSIENNMASVDKNGMSKTQKETLSRQLRELKGAGLVRPVKSPVIDLDQLRTYNVRKGTFIINPDMIRCVNHDEAEYLWSQCAERNDDNG